MARPAIGVLALQGAFAKHISILNSLGVEAIEIRKPEQLKRCHGLIIPGGESTTMVRQLRFSDLLGPLSEFTKENPIFGTCAGLILMANDVVDNSVESLNLLDITVERNGYGRQLESFSTDLQLKLNKSTTFHGVFIRAPRIKRFGSGIRVLAKHQGEPVAVQKDRAIACCFHPELTDNSAIHRYFLQLF